MSLLERREDESGNEFYRLYPFTKDYIQMSLNQTILRHQNEKICNYYINLCKEILDNYPNSKHVEKYRLNLLNNEHNIIHCIKRKDEDAKDLGKSSQRIEYEKLKILEYDKELKL